MSNKAKKIYKISDLHQNSDMPAKKLFKAYIPAIICFLFAFILYSNTFYHGYVLDDHDNFTNNKVIKKGVDGISTILTTNYRYGMVDTPDNLYRPLSQVMFAIEYQISPENPYLSHFLNVLFYALSCFLLFIVLRKYLSKVHSLIPLLITLLYAAHPIHTEVVANIKSRDEIMSFLFLMLTLLFLHSWFTKRKWWSLAVAVFMFFFSLLSKEGVITMIFLFPIIGWYFTDTKLKNNLIGSLLLIIPALVYVAIRYLILQKYGSAAIPHLTNFLTDIHDPVSHFATAITLLGKYLLLLIIPYQLVCDYSYSQLPVAGLLDIPFIISLLVYLALGFYAIKTIRKRSIITFGILLFMITISMYSNILFHMGTAFAERLMFLPSLGICIAFVVVIAQWMKIDSDNNQRSEIDILKSKPIFTAIFIIIILASSIKTFVRSLEWKDQLTLFKVDVKNSPNSAALHYFLGRTISDNAKKEKDEAVKNDLLSQAVPEFESSIKIYQNNADCYDELGLAYYLLKDNNKALDNYTNAIRINPHKVSALNNRGIIYGERNELDKAMDDFNKVISINPNFPDVYANKGCLLGILKKYDEAIENFKKCIELDPGNMDAQNYLESTYQLLNQQEKANK